MAHRPLNLETFDAANPKQAEEDNRVSMEAVESARIAGYDSGYKTGWDDAMQKSRADGERIGAEFARNLRDLSFTFHEARAHVLRSLDGLLDEISQTFLPGLMAEAIGPMIKESIETIASDAAGAPIQIRAAPEEAGRLRTFLINEADLPVQVIDEPSLAEGQAYLKLGAQERQVDLREPLDRLSAAIAALGSVTERTLDERNAG
ncbi:MAG: flagellar biosynthesis protein [Pseudomonadota bacterium]